MSSVNLRREKARRVATIGYAAEWLGGDNFLVRSHSLPSQHHGVEKRDERWICDCADYKKHRSGKCLHIILCQSIVDRWGDEVRDSWPAGYKIPTQDLDFGPIPAAEVSLYRGALRRVPPKILDVGHATYNAAYQRARRAWSQRIPELLLNLLYATGELHPEFFAVREGYDTKGGCRGRTSAVQAMAALIRVYFPLMSVQRVIPCANEMPDVLTVIGGLPGENTIGKYLAKQIVLNILNLWLTLTARVFANIATVAVADATFFSTATYENWLSTDRGKRPTRPWNTWIKGHVISDAATRVVGAVIPTRSRIGADGEGRDTIHDAKQIGPLLLSARSTWRRLRVLLGDKAYATKDLLEACRAAHIRLVVPPMKSMGPDLRAQFDIENLYDSDNAAFHELYRYRSVVESIFAATKGISGQYSSTHLGVGRATTREGVVIAQASEMIAKFLVHNLRRIVFFEHLLGEQITFWPYTEFRPLSPAQVISGSTLLTANQFEGDAA